MSSLGIFDKETKTYKKVADLSKPAVIDSEMSDSSTNAVQNKVVKSALDGKSDINHVHNDSRDIFHGRGDRTLSGYIAFAQIKNIKFWSNGTMEFKLVDRMHETPCIVSIRFEDIDNLDPCLASITYYGSNYGVFAHKAAVGTWLLYYTKNFAYDAVTVTDISTQTAEEMTVSITYPGTFITDKPTENVYDAELGYNVGSANLLYLPRLEKDANYQPGSNRIEAIEFMDSSSNLPENQWFHILTGQGDDARFNTQLALGMTSERMYYRNYYAGSWTSWKKIAYTSDLAQIQGEIDNLKKSVSDGKTTVANAITAKGVTTATDATFATMAGNISKITTGVDTSDATATAAQILTGQTAYVKGSKITGTLGSKITSFTRSRPTGLSKSRYDLAGASVGNYALFAGGYTSSGISSAVDAYDSSLTRSTPLGLSTSRYDLAGASVGNYALFAGGHTSSGISSAVDAYDSSLTRSTPTGLSESRSYLAGTSVGNYALFAGGHTSSGISSAVDAYDSSLTRSTPTGLSESRYDLAGASVGNYALFAGGSYSSAVDAYDSSLTRSTPTGLSTVRANLAGASVGNYALFAGGDTYGPPSSTVDAYDSSLTRSTPTGLSMERDELAGASVGNYALFAGGHNTSTVDAYDSSLTRSTPTGLSESRSYLAGTSVGNYALFAGGKTTSTVDAYIPPHIEIPSILI